MLYMNEYDITEAKRRHASHPIALRATMFLEAFKDEVNAHSDGWAYWKAPVKAAYALQLIAKSNNETTEREFKYSLRTIKSFYTRKGTAAGMAWPGSDFGVAVPQQTAKVFDTSSLAGLKAAESYKRKLENKVDAVKTTPVGLDKVKIEAVESLDAFAERINPRKFNFSPRLVAMVGAILGFDYGVRDGRGTRIVSLSITSDGFVIGHGESPDVSPFLGDVRDLERNIEVWTKDLTAADAKRFADIYDARVTDWRS